MNETARANEIEIVSDFVRSRNCVVLRGRFAPLWEDLDLHLLQNGHQVDPEHRRILRDLLVACALHHAQRPLDEMAGWTINLPDPPINLFVTGDTHNGIIGGRVFTRDVKETEQGRFYSQSKRARLPMRESVIEVEGRDAFAFVERYYRMSEQLPARFFRMGDDRVTMLVAHPDYDEDWFETVGVADMAKIDGEPLGPLEKRHYHFGCGCDATVIRRILRDASRGNLDSIFEGDPQLRVECPRCAGVFHVRREEMEA